MPPKRDKRKGGGAGNGGGGTGGGGGGAAVASRRMTRLHNAASSGAAAGNGAGGGGSTKRVSTPKPETGSGRNTNNSRGKRRVATGNRAPGTVKRTAGKRVIASRSKKEKELTSFKDENGEVYKTGGESISLSLSLTHTHTHTHMITHTTH